MELEGFRKTQAKLQIRSSWVFKLPLDYLCISSLGKNKSYQRSRVLSWKNRNSRFDHQDPALLYITLCTTMKKNRKGPDSVQNRKVSHRWCSQRVRMGSQRPACNLSSCDPLPRPRIEVAWALNPSMRSPNGLPVMLCEVITSLALLEFWPLFHVNLKGGKAGRWAVHDVEKRLVEHGYAMPPHDCPCSLWREFPDMLLFPILPCCTFGYSSELIWKYIFSSRVSRLRSISGAASKNPCRAHGMTWALTRDGERRTTTVCVHFDLN